MQQNILKIYNGLINFWQWNKKQKLIILDESITHVEFFIKNMQYSIPRDVYINAKGERVCDVPDDLLKTSGILVANACSHDTTIKSFRFSIMKNPKPGDYVDDDVDVSLDTDTKYQTVKIDDYNYKLQSRGKNDEAWSDVYGSTISIPSCSENIVVPEEIIEILKEVLV